MQPRTITVKAVTTDEKYTTSVDLKISNNYSATLVLPAGYVFNWELPDLSPFITFSLVSQSSSNNHTQTVYKGIIKASTPTIPQEVDMGWVVENFETYSDATIGFDIYASNVDGMFYEQYEAIIPDDSVRDNIQCEWENGSVYVYTLTRSLLFKPGRSVTLITIPPMEINNTIYDGCKFAYANGNITVSPYRD